MTVATKTLLEKDGNFMYIKNSSSQKLPRDIVTYWLLGLKSTAIGGEVPATLTQDQRVEIRTALAVTQGQSG